MPNSNHNLTIQELLATIGETHDEQRKWIRATVRDNIGKAEKKSQSTKSQYDKEYKRLNALRDADGLIHPHRLSKNKSSFYRQRAAICFGATKGAFNAIKDYTAADEKIRDARRNNDKRAEQNAREERKNCWKKLMQFAKDMAMYPANEAGVHSKRSKAVRDYKREPAVIRSLLDKPGRIPKGHWKVIHGTESASNAKEKSGKRKSKRSSTNNFNKHYPDWRTQAFNAISERWKTFAAIVSLTGCRPAELEGVIVRERAKNQSDRSNKAWLSFTIMGVKTNKGHGQVSRTIHIQESTDAAFQYLYRLVHDNGQLVAKAPVGGKPTSADRTAAFRMALKEAGETFIEKKHGTLSPYNFRHSFAADLKADGHSPEFIGVALSHSSTKTQSYYGRTNDGTKGRRNAQIDGHLNIKTKLSGKYSRRHPASATSPSSAFPFRADTSPVYHNEGLEAKYEYSEWEMPIPTLHKPNEN